MNTSDQSNGDSIDSPDMKSGAGVGRSYECSYCKRGFTNAQALGGHMNIHRKDKAKSKKKDFDCYNNSPRSHFFTGISSEQQHHQHQHQQLLYSSSLGAYMRCQLYIPGPNSSNYLNGFDLGSSSMKKDHRTLYEYRKKDQNLSLRIGSSRLEDHGGGRRENNMLEVEADVDLELRLGYP